MDAVQSSYVGRALLWMAEEGKSVVIEREPSPRTQGPRWMVVWDYHGHIIHGLGPELAAAIADAFRKAGAEGPHT